VGAIIGKAGVAIKETQSQTGARIQISHEPLPSSTEKTVTITGTPDAIHKAVSRVLTQLAQNPLKSSTKVYPFVPGQHLFPQFGLSPPHAGGYGAPQLPLYPSLPPPNIYSIGAHAPTSTQKIAIPTVCAGCVIGKGGSVIRDLRAQSGTNISIADPESNNPSERVVTLTGSAQGIQTAVYLIRQLVEQYQPAGNNSGNAGGGSY